MFIHWQRRGALLCPLVLVACSSGASPERQQTSSSALGAPVNQKTYDTVQVATWPNARCLLIVPNGPDAAQPPLPVFADDLGVAQFGAIHAARGDIVTNVELSCEDSGGSRRQVYTVDLTAASAFDPIPASALPAPPKLRPALTGDPMSYSQNWLVQNGYGFRPNPNTSPDAYQAWLKVATQVARVATPPGAPLPGHANAVTDQPLPNGPGWAGGMLLDNPGQPDFEGAEFDFTIPRATVTPGCSAAAIWGGLGGWLNADLIQTGVQLFGNGTVVTYNSWYEYWSGAGVGGNCYQNECSLGVNVAPGNQIIASTWACDSSGNFSYSGGYGCFQLQNQSESPPVIVNCTTPSGACPSLAQINTYVGASAEAIVEDNGPNNFCGVNGTFTNFGTVSDGRFFANDTTGNTRDWATDGTNNQVTVINASGQTLATATLTSAQATAIQWVQGQ
jgi:hypothetical protein